MSTSSASAKRRRENDDGVVTMVVDLAEVARCPLTASEIAQLEALEGREPDTDDIPEAPAENWAFAIRGKFYKPRKEAISLRVDMDVLHWLRGRGPGYQTEINRILRERMREELITERRLAREAQSAAGHRTDKART